MKLEIGGGTIPKQGYINIDPTHGKGVWKRMAQDTPWPVADNSVDAVRASHVLEHIPVGYDDRIKVMNEVHRVLRPGRYFEIIVPCIQVNGQMTGWQGWADPTHSSFWVYPESFLYFCDGAFRANADYGIKYFAALEDGKHEVRNGWEAVVHLRKP